MTEILLSTSTFRSDTHEMLFVVALMKVRCYGFKATITIFYVIYNKERASICARRYFHKRVCTGEVSIILFRLPRVI